MPTLRELARSVFEHAPYKDQYGRVYLRVHAPWEAEVYDRRGARPSLHVGDLFRLDVEDMHLAAVPGFGYAYVPRHGRERAVEACRGAVAQDLVTMEIRSFPADAVVVGSGAHIVSVFVTTACGRRRR